jgi:hypothetical protein
VTRGRILATAWLLAALALVPTHAPALAAAPAVSGQRLALFRQLAVLEGQFRMIDTPRPACARTRAARAADTALLRRATAGAGKASAGALKARAALLRRAIARRRAAACAQRAQDPPAAAPTTRAPPPSQPPGTGRSGPVIVGISLAGIVRGETLDLAPSIGDARLPASLAPRELSGLNDRSCRGAQVICIGLDRALLQAELQDLVNRNTLELVLGNVLTLNLSGLLTQIDTLLGGGGLSELIAVERVDDRRLRLRPLGPLARLATLEDIQHAIVGQIEVAGVIRCPPAEVGGLPRACVS